MLRTWLIGTRNVGAGVSVLAYLAMSGWHARLLTRWRNTESCLTRMTGVYSALN